MREGGWVRLDSARRRTASIRATSTSIVERLDEVVISARSQPAHDGGRSIDIAQQDNGRVAEFADTAQQLKAVEARHLNVGHDEIRPLPMERADAFEAISGLDDIQLGIERSAHNVAQLRIIIDDEDTC